MAALPHPDLNKMSSQSAERRALLNGSGLDRKGSSAGSPETLFAQPLVGDPETN